MQHLLKLLKWDHTRFTVLLNYLEGAIQDLGPDDEIDFHELIDLMCYLRPGLKGRHQAEEWILWELITQQTGTVKRVAQHLQEMNHSVIERGSVLENQIRAGRDGATIQVPELRRLAAPFIREFRQQIALEEEAIFPLINTLQADSATFSPNAISNAGSDSYRHHEKCHKRHGD